MRRYCITGWAGNAGQGDRDRIDRLIKRVQKVTGQSLPSCHEVYKKFVTSKYGVILSDVSHPLHEVFVSCIIPRSGRVRIPAMKTNRYARSFIPCSLKMYNEHHKR